MNKVFLKGNVGQDPKITTFQDGGKVAQFSLATTERGFTTRDGKQIPDVTDWHNIVVKRTGLAGVCEQFVKKGTPQPIIDKLTAAYKMALNDSKFVNYASMNGLDVIGLTGKEARSFMNTWRSQMSWLIYDAGAGKDSPEKFGIPKPAN